MQCVLSDSTTYFSESSFTLPVAGYMKGHVIAKNVSSFLIYPSFETLMLLNQYSSSRPTGPPKLLFDKLKAVLISPFLQPTTRLIPIWIKQSAAKIHPLVLQCQMLFYVELNLSIRITRRLAARSFYQLNRFLGNRTRDLVSVFSIESDMFIKYGNPISRLDAVKHCDINFFLLWSSALEM